MENQTLDVKKQTLKERYFTKDNPVTVIAAAIVISAFMTIISLGLYLRSDTKKTVDLLQNAEKTVHSSSSSSISSVSTTGPLTAKDLETIRDGVINKVDVLDDEADFSVTQVTDAALGL